MKDSSLTEITKENFDVIFDLRYATKNNVCEIPLYSEPFCYLHNSAISPLQKAIEAAKKIDLKLKIFDSFRPIEVQKFMFEKFPSDEGSEGFISDPENGAIPHCRGVALDLTLTDLNGNELDMGTDFDEFSSLAFHNSFEVSKEAQKNRLILLGLMSAAGWDFYSKEWWHYQLFSPRNYPVVKSKESLLSKEIRESKKAKA